MSTRYGTTLFYSGGLMALLGEHTCDRTLIDFLLGELATFTGADWEQEDDVTMVVVNRDPLPTT